MFYLPEYPMYLLQVGVLPLGFYAPQSAVTMILTEETRSRCRAEVKRLVWFVDHWDPALPRPPGLLEVQLPYGRYLYVLPLGRIRWSTPATRSRALAGDSRPSGERAVRALGPGRRARA